MSLHVALQELDRADPVSSRQEVVGERVDGGRAQRIDGVQPGSVLAHLADVTEFCGAR